MRLGLVCSVVGFALAACVGDDPAGSSPLPRDDAGSGSSSGEMGSSGAPQADAATQLVLEAEPLTVVEGSPAPSSLRVRLVSGSGPATLRLTNPPPGLAVATVAELPAGATSADFSVSAPSGFRHGDYALTIAADAPSTASVAATVVVRGAPGAFDTGFGQLGSYRGSFLAAVAPLPDGRTVLARTASPFAVSVLDATGTPTVVNTLLGGMQPAFGSARAYGLANSAFVVRDTDSNYSLFDPATTYTGKILATPSSVAGVLGEGLLVAQRTTAAYEVRRYAGLVSDPLFGDAGTISIPVNEDSAPPFGVLGTPNGGFWVVGNTSQFAAMFRAWNVQGTTVSEGRTMGDSNPTLAAVFGNDLLLRVATGEPANRILRVRLDPNATDGFSQIPLTSQEGRQGLATFGAERIYILTQAAAPDPTSVIRAFGPDGAPATLFGTNGTLTLTTVIDAKLAVDARGRLLVSGYEEVGADIQPIVQRIWD